MNLDEIFSQIARENKTTADEVKKEIVSVINNLKNSSHIKERHLFLSLFGNDNNLTAEEIVLRLARVVGKVES